MLGNQLYGLLRFSTVKNIMCTKCPLYIQKMVIGGSFEAIYSFCLVSNFILSIVCNFIKQRFILVCLLMLCFSWGKNRLDNGQVENLALWWVRRSYTGQSSIWRISKMQHNYLPSKAKMRGIVILSTYTWACLVFYQRVRSNYAIPGTPTPLQYG